MIQIQEYDQNPPYDGQTKGAGFKADIEKLAFTYREMNDEIESLKKKCDQYEKRLNEKPPQEIVEKLADPFAEIPLEMQNKMLWEEFERLEKDVLLSTPNEKDKVAYEEDIVKLKDEIQEFKVKYENGDIVKRKIYEVPVEKLVDKIEEIKVDKIVEKFVEVPIEIIKPKYDEIEKYEEMFKIFFEGIMKRFNLLIEFTEKKLKDDDSRISEIVKQLIIKKKSPQE